MADNQSQPPPSPPPSSPPEPTISLTITHHGTPHTFTFPPTATLPSLSTQITTTLSIPPTHQKLLITPKPGLLKPPFPPLPLSTLLPPKTKILLLAPTPTDLASLSNPHPRSPTTTTTTKKPPPKPTPYRPSALQTREEATYTFHTLLPLPHLPNPTLSLNYLERLRADRGIKAVMRSHRFSVGLLTEMDPVQHTTHDSRTLGLNRNKGEVIELRLRTDAFDGYRDYRGVRDTLAHELAHCVFGEHDARFWELCRRIEREVRVFDGGRALTEEVFYEPLGGGGGEHVDGGGWTGGEFVLGGVRGEGGEGLGRREAMARAAEERVRRQREAGGESGEG